MSKPLLDEAARVKLGRIAGMFGSNHDGEVASAARRAHSLLAAHGTTLEAILARYAELEKLVVPSADPVAGAAPFSWSPASALRVRIDSLLGFNGLSVWERAFLESIRHRSKLSEGQRGKLNEIWEQHWGRAAA